MKLHEYQAKQIFARFGVAVPPGRVASTVDEALESARGLGGDTWVVKAQIHAGGRGKGGGVRVSRGMEALKANAQAILGMNLITHQTGPQGKQVQKVLIEAGMDIQKELYVSFLVDRAIQAVVMLASTEGGMDIETVAADSPEKILREEVDPAVGLLPFQAVRMAYRLGVDQTNPKLVRPAADLLMGLYRVFTGVDCTLVEVNPLVLTGDGRVVALDAKLVLDDNALFRRREEASMRDLSEEEPLEVEANDAGLNYIRLDGNIGCMVNGAGLAMGTMDIIKTNGGDPANFLDVGGTADQARVEAAFRIIAKDPHVKAILVNIFGGIVRCDIVAQGIVGAFKTVGLSIPVVVRLQGNNAEEAHRMIEQSGLGAKLIMADGLRDAAVKAVEAAR
ncbi:MAG: ADP-forming succinate--CoA ligase subunit beta [Deltaproteobacteria bacterium]|nr:ADP-forming succinate--CoA ligase subunit beta [Deltaproteobacteria bacterium]